MKEIIQVNEGNGLYVNAHRRLNLAASLSKLDLPVDSILPILAIVAQECEINCQAKEEQSSKAYLNTLLKTFPQQDSEEGDRNGDEQSQVVGSFNKAHHVVGAHQKLPSIEEEDVLDDAYCCQGPISLLEDEGVDEEVDDKAVCQHEEQIRQDLLALRSKKKIHTLYIALVRANEPTSIEVVGNEAIGNRKHCHDQIDL